MFNWGNPDEQDDIEMPDAASLQRQLLAAQYEFNGMIAPTHRDIAGRVPYRSDGMPFTFYSPETKAEDRAFSDMFTNALYAREHLDRSTTEEFANSRPIFPYKRGGAIVNLFTREIHGPEGQTSGIVMNNFMPRNTTDEDIRLANTMAQTYPVAHGLAADQWFWTAPGQDFRHGGN
jgi:hypothetical protein